MSLDVKASQEAMAGIAGNLRYPILIPLGDL
ncbi:MAG: hypothetical protein CM1200mP24_07060 [Gammaproteobacteria bacterium]|nr:MAG: hypothetical protein CM1200mP24_07060 [Gammaproteobacteria bacterium]